MNQKRKSNSEFLTWPLSRYGLLIIVMLLVPSALFAQTQLEANIRNAIDALITILNLLLIAVVAWAGFQLARGEHSGVSKLIYAVAGLVVINSSRMIIDYFTRWIAR